MTQAEVNFIIELHKKWLKREVGGKRADFEGATLIGIDFISLNLLKANFKDATLVEAKFRDVNLSGVNFKDATLVEAKFRDVNLFNANFEEANLSGASFHYVNLKYANLKNTNLRYVNFKEVRLNGANLEGATIDFTSWPIWCGSFDIQVNADIINTLCYHICRLDTIDPEGKKVQKLLAPYANKASIIKRHELSKIEAEEIKE